MNITENMNTKEIEKCPICEANAVESCNQPKEDDCPRDDN